MTKLKRSVHGPYLLLKIFQKTRRSEKCRNSNNNNNNESNLNFDHSLTFRRTAEVKKDHLVFPKGLTVASKIAHWHFEHWCLSNNGYNLQLHCQKTIFNTLCLCLLFKGRFFLRDGLGIVSFFLDAKASLENNVSSSLPTSSVACLQSFRVSKSHPSCLGGKKTIFWFFQKDYPLRPKLHTDILNIDAYQIPAFIWETAWV